MRWKVPDIKGWERVQVRRCKVTVCSSFSQREGDWLEAKQRGREPCKHTHPCMRSKQFVRLLTRAYLGKFRMLMRN